MKTIIRKILGLNKEALELSSEQTQKAYYNQGYALFFVSFIAFGTGLEIGMQFTASKYLITSTGVLFSFLVFVMDYFLLSNSNTNFFGALSRILFGLTIVVLSTVSILLLINETDINNHVNNLKKDKIEKLDSLYEVQKSERYKNLKNLEAKQNEYYNTILQPEALNGGAGAEYLKKSIKYNNDSKAISAERKRLDSVEAGYYKTYNQKKSKIKLDEKLGMFEKAELLYFMIAKSMPKKVFAIVLIIFLLGIELTALLTKFSILNNNEYKDWLAKIEADKKRLIDRQRASDIDIKFEQEDLQSKIEKLLMLQHLKNSFAEVCESNPSNVSDDLIKEVHRIINPQIEVLLDETQYDLNKKIDFTDTNENIQN